jgi:hypothetical protein
VEGGSTKSSAPQIEMDKLVRNWVIALTLGSIMAAILLAFGVSLIFKEGGRFSLPNLLICLVSGTFLGVDGWHWIRLLKGKVLFKKNETLALNGGELIVPMPAGPFDLWIFCRVSFAQYYGNISITASDGSNHVINVPRRNPFFYPVRSNLVPIVWHSSDGKAQGKCRIVFHLSSTFVGTAYDRRLQKNNVESVTAIIKTAGRLTQTS